MRQYLFQTASPLPAKPEKAKTGIVYRRNFLLKRISHFVKSCAYILADAADMDKKNWSQEGTPFVSTKYPAFRSQSPSVRNRYLIQLSNFCPAPKNEKSPLDQGAMLSAGGS
ncbi:MAG: hypothetical protein IJY48_02550, partial [Mailhella sp.]|nr:hypothetical protein [Mailhella sp.]